MLGGLVDRGVRRFVLVLVVRKRPFEVSSGMRLIGKMVALGAAISGPEMVDFAVIGPSGQYWSAWATRSINFVL